VTRRGNRVYVVKRTPKLPRPEPTQEAGDQPLGSTEGGPQLIYTRKQSSSMRPLRANPPDTSQLGRTATGQGGAGAAGLGAETVPTTSPIPTMGTGPVTVRQVLDESLAQATQQLTMALPNWAATPNGIVQLQALLQDVLTRAEAQRPGITTRPIPWTHPSSPRNKHFPPVLYVGAPGEYAVGGADPTPLLSLAEPAAKAMLARRLSQLPAHTGTRLNERVPVGAHLQHWGPRDMGQRQALGGGRHPRHGGDAVVDWRAGMRQMGWTDKDAVPNAVQLGLANGHSTNLHGLTRKTVKFEFNPRSPTKISIAVRAVVTDAPYDFLVGNIILWTIGATLDAWREELHYRVD
jgi:hypothetical protein